MNNETNNSNSSDEQKRQTAPIAPGKAADQDGNQKDKVVTDKPAQGTPEPVKAVPPASK